MITTADFYNNYTEAIRLEIKENETQISNYKASKRYLADNLRSFKYHIINSCNLLIEDIVEANETDHLLKLSRTSYVITNNNGELEVLLNIVKNLIKLNQGIIKAEKSIRKLEKEQLTYKIFKFIIKDFNIQIGEAILNGYEYSFGSGVSTIFVNKRKRFFGETHDGNYKYKSINWGESNKLKKVLIEEGKLPYAILRDEKGVRIGDNGGVNWFVYFTNDYDFWWAWKKKSCLNTNRDMYSFDPSYDQKRALSARKVDYQKCMDTYKEQIV